MKILTMSDSHSKHRRIPKEWFLPADIIIHGGDISNIGELYDIEDFCKWYSELNYTHKIFCAGNHDWGFERDPNRVADIIAKYPNITYLQDSSIVIDGIKIYCSPWQPEFYSWAFNLKRGKEIQKKWDLIENDTNILVTHGPAYGILDITPNGEFVGCVDLLDTIVTKLDSVKLHICGHIHNGRGSLYKHGKTFVNASVLNERYEIAFKPILIDFNKETKEANIIE